MDGGPSTLDPPPAGTHGAPGAAAVPAAAQVSAGASVASAEVLARIAEVAWTLEPLAPHERAGLLRSEAGLLLDGLLVRVARGEGAIDVALGEGLEAVSADGRLCRLGSSSLADYARERLGLLAGTAQRLVRLAKALRERPLLRGAVRRGEVSARKAEAVLPVARGEDEAAWVARARTETVRALCVEVGAAMRAARSAGMASGGGAGHSGDSEGSHDSAGEGGGAVERFAEGSARLGAPAVDGDPDLDGPWTRISHLATPEQRARVAEALALAGEVLGVTTPVWRRVEAVCEEYLGAHPAEPTAEELAALDRPRSLLDPPELDALKEGLELEYHRWEFLEEAERFEAPPPPCEDGAPVDPLALDARLRELAAMREAWDPLVGHLGMLVQNTGLWRDMMFASVGHYAEERLGMSGRALEQRAALERRLWYYPELRDAVRARRLSYEKARLVASHAAGRDVAALVARAEGLTCIALRRSLEAEEQGLAAGGGGGAGAAAGAGLGGGDGGAGAAAGAGLGGGDGGAGAAGGESGISLSPTGEERGERGRDGTGGADAPQLCELPAADADESAAQLCEGAGAESWTSLSPTGEEGGERGHDGTGGADAPQLCELRELSLVLPRRVALLATAAIHAARDVAGRWLRPGEALAAVADHFVEAWQHERAGRKSRAQRVLARDRGFCQVPGCSRAADHAHHVQFRSRGGGDELENLVGLCAVHHLHGVHAGHIRVRGRAPDALVWEMAAPPTPPPRWPLATAG